MKQLMLKAEALIDPLVQANFHIETSIAYTTPLHCHDYYEIFIITSGKCIHKVNDQEQILYTGSMVFIRPEDNHYYDYYLGEDCQFININFYTEVVEYALNFIGDRNFVHNLTNPVLPPHFRLTADEMEFVVGKGKQMLMYTSFDKSKSKILAKNFLIETLSLFYLNEQSKLQPTIPDWFDSLLYQMQKKENFCAGLTKLYDISRKSKGHLNRVFKQYLNTTPTNYINHLKLNYARNLLSTTNLEIIDVAFEAGFDNVSHFYHLFKKIYGITPGKVRYQL